jgi:hypothetical protein
VLKLKGRISSWTRLYKTAGRPCPLLKHGSSRFKRSVRPLVSLSPRFSADIGAVIYLLFTLPSGLIFSVVQRQFRVASMTAANSRFPRLGPCPSTPARRSTDILTQGRMNLSPTARWQAGYNGAARLSPRCMRTTSVCRTSMGRSSPSMIAWLERSQVMAAAFQTWSEPRLRAGS